MLKSGLTSRYRRIIPVALFILASLAFTQMSRFTNPASHAYAGDCLERSEDGWTYTNSCGFDINLSYCLEDEIEGDYKTCPVTRLAPAQSASPGDAGRLETDTYGHRRIWACKYPFRPEMVPGNANPNLLREGCRSAKD